MLGKQRRELCLLLLDRAADLLTEPQHAGIGDAVDRARSPLLTANDPLSMQQAQVLGDVRVAGLHLLGYLAHRCLPASAEHIEDPDTHGIAERRKPRRDELRKVRRDRGIAECHDRNYSVE